MNIKKLLAKMIKGEELTDAEKDFVKSYDPAKAANDAAAAARRKSEDELNKVQAKLDELTANADAAKKKADEEKQNGMTEIEKLTAKVQELTDKVTTSESKAAEAEKKAASTLKSQTIRIKAKEAGIVLAPNTVDEKLFFDLLEARLSDIDVNDADKLKESLDAFKTANAGIISAGGPPGPGNIGDPNKTFTGKNPWSKESFNLTKQMELETNEPEKATSLKVEAGVEG